MLLTHLGRSPHVEPTAYVAPTATVCGDVAIGAHCRIMHGASIVAEGGRIEIGECCIIMENAVVRSTGRHSTRIGRLDEATAARKPVLRWREDMEATAKSA